MLDNVSFKSKLAYSFALVCALLVVQAIFSYAKIGTMSEQIRMIIDDRLPKDTQANDLTQNTL